MSEHHLDALVVGTGFAGIYALRSLLQLGLNVKAIDAASDVGGTWYWSRYPGARSDTWSHLYRYSFDTEYPLKRRYVTQPEVLAYLQHIADTHDLRPHMKFNTHMTSATWDEATSTWRIVCKTGDVFHARYLLTALGLLTRANYPDIPGQRTFKGEIRHTSAWSPELDLRGKRVGLVGVGSSGVQIVSAIADAVKSLHVFIRHPQYVVPSGDRELTPSEREEIARTYPKLWAEARTSALALGFPELGRQAMALSPADREEAFELLWQAGSGLQFLFGGFSDLVTDPAANEAACKFLRRKIAEIVTDPQKRAALMPTELFARRPPCANGYYEQFNRENVFAVDVKAHPITGVEEAGIRTADDKLHELDVIIFATGYDAMDGAYVRLDIQGRNPSDSLRERWKTAGPASYLGMSVPDFPNLLMINGPLTPFANIPPISEENVRFIVDLIKQAEEVSRLENRPCLIEATEEAQREWGEHCDQISDGLLLRLVPQWLFGQNVPGKATSTLFYLGGVGRFRAFLADVKARGFAGFKGLLGEVAEEPRANL
ncbi:flavin-containing monooxygenase [Aspergillus clavatus NRRL 1]|uniref:Cyclohexanone monooxygenase, putative n=1 Tax=Aspergillus clavatus (strain ATCC 1007 / CBS 513.65 / DSM 816 / NCTC 3887 / NRRL 1 / QM 1276 / 107) TaxID=344612 RepID=A1CSZ5_ASPCL|nr:cyclohexanone monooxygenase, putative [Aspergillus clavatus NRRL 1]EAW06432.1 cyclohexanone monooxygenase, putative [Aspergillus clavatus NRRL 1]